MRLVELVMCNGRATMVRSHTRKRNGLHPVKSLGALFSGVVKSLDFTVGFGGDFAVIHVSDVRQDA